MGKLVRVFVVMVALAFGLSSMAIAEEFYIVKDASGKTAVVDKKPADEKTVVKGPFKTKDEADKAMKAASTTKPKLPDQGC
jgi:hypothetical protein